MNLKEYIASGIIESNLLGIATDAEREEFEAMCKLHPEIEQARILSELQLEQLLLQDAVPPPPQVKGKILDFIANAEAANVSDEEQKDETPVRRLSIWKIMAAASVILLAGALFWAFTVNTKYQQVRQANADLKRQLDQNTVQLSQLKADAQMMQKPGVKMAAMQGTPNAPDALATVYWDTTTKDVYLMINNLPEPASDKQYQLWALINNQPVDLGVFEMRQEKLLVKMKNVQNAQAFAITLEPKGGSPTPTTSAMYVVGKL
ncbi:MAG: anti-sigma factor [Bacteroidota bacterium]|nr:anti-sigma factor [Flavisolibacter sp.]MDQ3846132.1 anti-sigma factor [Bacteroidota bacterium]MBD0298090.1 anti-sigma factor [Flavisolibacter sp.]MBD0351408.1 anti-sigma factor [Flavisolibacter sp.]MBD0368796.1 anti-sigma factor [Flavisolibacter sp.]